MSIIENNGDIFTEALTKAFKKYVVNEFNTRLLVLTKEDFKEVDKSISDLVDSLIIDLDALVDDTTDFVSQNEEEPNTPGDGIPDDTLEIENNKSIDEIDDVMWKDCWD